MIEPGHGSRADTFRRAQGWRHRRGIITGSWVAKSHVRAIEHADFRSDLPAAIPAGFCWQDVTGLPDHQPGRLAHLCGLSPPFAGCLDHPRRSGGPARRRSVRLEPHAPARRHAHLKSALKAGAVPGWEDYQRNHGRRFTGAPPGHSAAVTRVRRPRAEDQRRPLLREFLRRISCPPAIPMIAPPAMRITATTTGTLLR